MVTVESVLAGTVLRSGMDPDDGTITFEQAARGRRASMRRIETIVGARLQRAFPNGKGDVPVDVRELPREYARRPGEYLSAVIPLGGAFSWDRGRILTGPSGLPQTLVQALEGQHARRLIEHPDIDPDAILLLGDEPEAQLMLPVRTVELASRAGPIKRMRLLLERERREFRERLPHAVPGLRKRVLGMCLSNTMILIPLVAMAIGHNPYRYFVLPFGVAASAASLAMLWATATVRIGADSNIESDHFDRLKAAGRQGR